MPAKSPTSRDRLGGHVRDLTGLEVGSLVAQRYISTRPEGSDGALQMALWECRCTRCGAIETKARRLLVNGSATCSSCARRIREDLTGRTFGRLTVAGLAPIDGTTNQSRWTCVCACGAVRVFRRSALSSGDSRSCGCLRREASAARNQARAADAG